jgi:hypothetical protein
VSALSAVGMALRLVFSLLRLHQSKVMKPAAHLCTIGCRIRCLFGVHVRPDAETRCRCCKRKAYGEEQAAGRTRDHGRLTLKWWETPSPADQAIAENAEAQSRAKKQAEDF